MEKVPMLYSVVFRCHENVGYILLIDVMFCKVHRIGPRNMCVDFERNRLRIEDFRKSEKIVCFLWRDVARKRDVVRQSEGRLQKRHSVRNVFQPTRSFYDFRFKSYGPLCDFYKSGDLDLDLYPILTQKNCQGPWNWVHELSNFQKDRTSRVACTSCNYGQTNRQTDRQTNRGDQYTLQKSTILQSNERIIGDLTFYIDFGWHWPLTLTPWPLTLTLTVIYFCKNLMLWRRVTQNGASYIRMEITLR